MDTKKWQSPTRARHGGRLASGLTAAVLGGVIFGLLLAPALPAQEPPVPPPPGGPEAVVGSWLGNLALPGGVSLRIAFHIEMAEEGALSATADSPDQGVRGIPVTEASFDEGELVLEMASIGARFVGAPGADGTLAGEWSQGGQGFPLNLERVEGEVAGPPRPQEPEPPFPYRTEEVRYPNPGAGIHLAGTLTLPEGEGPFPAVALVSGSGAQNRDSEVFGHRIFLVLADYLTRQGIAVLRSDDRGVGESEGVFAEATSRDFAGDAAAAAAWLRAHSEIDPKEVGLVGLSEGGLIAPMVATESDEIAFIVLMAGPGLPGEEILYMQGELIARAGGTSDEHIAWNRGVQEGLFRAVKEEQEEAGRSDRTRQVLGAIEAGLDEAGNPDVTVRELPGLNHLFQTAHTGSPAEYAQIEETMSPEALEIVARWILERVGEGRNGDRVP